MDPKEAEIQRQRELIGDMRDNPAGGQKKKRSSEGSLPEKENSKIDSRVE